MTQQTQHNDSTNVKTTIRLMQPYGLAYAYVDHVGIQRDYEPGMLKTDQESLKFSIMGDSSRSWSPNGHRWVEHWPEITNNMWSNYAHIKHGNE